MVPLKTFWLPVVNVEEDYVDPNSEEALKYRTRVEFKENCISGYTAAQKNG